MKTIKPPVSRHALGFLLVFSLLAAALISTGRFYFRNYEKRYMEGEQERVSAVADLKVDEISQWRENHFADAWIFFNNPSFSDLVSGLTATPSDTAARHRLADWLDRFSVTEDYDQIRLLSPKAEILDSFPPSDEPTPEAVTGRLREVLESRQMMLQDFYPHGRSGKAGLAMLVPIYDHKAEGGPPMAVLMMRIDPETHLFAILKRWRATSATAETFLMRREGNEPVYLSPLRFHDNQIPESHAQSDTPGRSSYQIGDSIATLDYRKVPVLAAVRPIPDTPWSLVASVTTEEVLKTVHERLWQIITIISTLLFASAAFFVFLWKQHSIRFYQEKVADAELLAASEARFRRTFELAAIGIAHIDLDGRWLRLNTRACEILGYSADELHHMRFQDTTHPEDLPECLEMARRIQRGELESETLEKRYIRKDGTVVPTQVTVALSRETASEGPYLISIIEDITERHSAEAQLREAEQRYRNIVEISPDAIFTNRMGRIDYINTAGLNLLRATSRDEVIGRSPLDFFPPDFHPVVQERIAALLEKPCSAHWMEQKLLALDGTPVDIEVAAVSFVERGEMLIQVVCRDLTRRRKAEAELRRTAGLLQAVADGTSEAVFVKDLEGRYLLFNEAASRFVGKTAAEVIGKDDMFLFDAEGAARVMEFDRLVRDTGIARTDEEKLTAAGVTRYYLGTKAPYRDSSGAIIGTVGTSHDISERKQTERELARTNSLLNATLESTADGILVVDSDGKVASFNRKFLELWRIPPELIATQDDKLVLQSILDQLLDPEGFLAKVEELYQHPDADSWDELEFKDGRSFERYSQPQRIGEETVGRVWSFRDITGRKQTEESNARLATAVEQASEMIMITDLNARIQYVNPSFERTTGYSKEEVLGRNPRMFKSGKQDAVFYQKMWSTLAAGTVWSGHMTNRRKDGTFFEEEATISPILDPAGKILNYVAVKRDVTREFQLQEQFRQAQKMDAVGRLAGGVAHDFNNILGTILLQADLAEMTVDLAPSTRDAFKEIRTDAQRAANLTRQLLLFSRQQAMRMQDLDLNEVVSNVSRMLQRIIGEDVPLGLRLAAKALPLHGDPGTLEQVLLNLAVNARDAMPAGGNLTITTGDLEVTGRLARDHPDAQPGRYVFVSVADTGIGIPKEIVPRIFEPFFTTKDVGKGTGLGLATVFGIVKQHSGWISVHSQPGEGTTFRIHLPLKEITEKAPASTEVEQAPGGNETILVTEDEATLRSLICHVLRKNGYKVIQAATGAEAMTVWQENRDRVDLLLTDMVMPGGMTGRELAATLQARNPELHTLLMSGYSVDLTGQGQQLRSNETFLQKPFLPNQLLAAVRQSLSS